MAWPSLTTRSFLSSLLFCFISPTILISFSNKKNPIIVTLATKPSQTALHAWEHNTDCFRTQFSSCFDCTRPVRLGLDLPLVLVVVVAVVVLPARLAQPRHEGVRQEVQQRVPRQRPNRQRDQKL